MIFTLGDFTFAVAANATGRLTVSLDNTISFQKPAKGSILFAKARELSAGKTVCQYQVEITDELETKIATMLVTGFCKGENHILDND